MRPAGRATPRSPTSTAGACRTPSRHSASPRSTALAAPAVAHADSALSFVHAVPGAGKATLQAGSTRVGEEGFAGASAYRNVRSGATTLTLKSADGKTLTTKTLKLADGTRYAVVALLNGMKPVLELVHDLLAVDPDLRRAELGDGVDDASELGHAYALGLASGIDPSRTGFIPFSSATTA